MVKLFFFTTAHQLRKIEQKMTITSQSETLFAPAWNGIYFVDRNPEEQTSLPGGSQFDCYVEIDFPSLDRLMPCAPEGGAKVYLYQRPVLELSQFEWSSGFNSGWKSSGSLNWGSLLGIAAVTVGAAVAGKMAYDAYNGNKKSAITMQDAARKCEDMVDSMRSVASSTDAFVEIGKKTIPKLKSLDYIGGEGAVSGHAQRLMNSKVSQGGQNCDVEEDFVCVSEYLNHSGAEMSQASQLEALYRRKVKIDQNEKQRYRSLLNFLLDDVVSKMRETSKTFDALFSKIYYGGSFFDGLKVGSTDQEFDLNIIFKWREEGLEVVRLGEDSKKRNFCFLKVTKSQLSKAEEKVVNTDYYGDSPIVYLSPLKMFNLIKSCIDRVLSHKGHTVNYNGQLYRVTRHEFAPVTLKVVSLDLMEEPVRFEVDLVPSLQLSLGVLEGNFHLENRITSLCQRYQVPLHERNCMAISLHRADQVKFELDFHDIERRILYNRGCVKKVIKLVKYLRDTKGGTVSKLWSHLLKVRVSFLIRIYPSSTFLRHQ